MTATPHSSSDVRAHRRNAFGAYLATRTPRVLVAEDDDEMRTLLSSRLRRDGYRVIEVPDGRRLSRLLQAYAIEAKHDGHPIDLVISDIRMPGRSGLDALAGIRSSDLKVPFIVISGSGDVETHVAALRLGAAAVFDKPFDLDDLCTAVVDLVGR